MSRRRSCRPRPAARGAIRRTSSTCGSALTASRYRPMSGGFGADDTALELPAAEQRCIDDAARAAFARGRLPANLFPLGIRVGLSLGGTTNWAGPPEVFGLAIDAGDPGLVAVTC